MSNDDKIDVRAMRRAARAAQKAQRAQEKADRARAEALAAVRASGFDVTDARYDVERESTVDTTAAADQAPRDTDAPPPAARESALERRRRERDKATLTDKESASTDAVDDDTEDSADSAALSTASSEQQRPWMKILSAVAVVAVILGALAWFGYSEQTRAVEAEQAETDAPQAAGEAARQVITTMFTYDWENVDDQMAAVEPRLTGAAAEEFRNETRTNVSSLSKSVEANSYATVAAVGVEKVDDQDHVTTVVMLNRMVSTKDQPEAQSSATRLRVAMERVDDNGSKVWKVAKIEVL